jgi:hypothetical protein
MSRINCNGYLRIDRTRNILVNGGRNEMNTENVPRQSERAWSRWQDWANVIVGVWIFASPWIMRTASIADVARNSWILGAIVVVVALRALSQPNTIVPDRINALAGLWLIVSPWILRSYGFVNGGLLHGAALNAWVSGFIVFVLSMWATAKPQETDTHPTGTPVHG